MTNLHETRVIFVIKCNEFPIQLFCAKTNYEVEKQFNNFMLVSNMHLSLILGNVRFMTSHHIPRPELGGPGPQYRHHQGGRRRGQARLRHQSLLQAHGARKVLLN